MSIPDGSAVEIESLEEPLATTNEVIDYTPDRGFHTVPRNPAIDAPDAIVRVPPVDPQTRLPGGGLAPEDIAALRRHAGSDVDGQGAILPSGRTLDATEAQALASFYAEDADDPRD